MFIIATLTIMSQHELKTIFLYKCEPIVCILLKLKMRTTTCSQIMNTYDFVNANASRMRVNKPECIGYNITTTRNFSSAAQHTQLALFFLLLISLHFLSLYPSLFPHKPHLRLLLFHNTNLPHTPSTTLPTYNASRIVPSRERDTPALYPQRFDFQCM